MGSSTRDIRCVATRDGGAVRLLPRTRAGRLRHPRFLGLRDDKPARKVVREG